MCLSITDNSGLVKRQTQGGSDVLVYENKILYTAMILLQRNSYINEVGLSARKSCIDLRRMTEQQLTKLVDQDAK